VKYRNYYCEHFLLSQAGIPQTQLLLISEPEAATIFCIRSYMNSISYDKRRNKSNLFEQGTLYMVLDAGGRGLTPYNYDGS
jgi:hypothetical protein